MKVLATPRDRGKRLDSSDFEGSSSTISEECHTNSKSQIYSFPNVTELGNAYSMLRCHLLKENRAMTGIQFVTDEKGRKVAV